MIYLWTRENDSLIRDRKRERKEKRMISKIPITYTRSMDNIYADHFYIHNKIKKWVTV
jgi:hypothetical protein